MRDPVLINSPEYRGIRLEEASEDLSLQAVLAGLSAIGFPCSEDRILRWRSAYLIGPGLASGSGNGKMIALEDVRRLVVIADLHRRFALERMTDAEIGFWLASGGFEVPSCHVCDAIASGVHRFTSLLARQLGRRLPASWMLLDNPADSHVMKAAKSIVKTFKKFALPGAAPVAQLFLEGGAHVFIGQVFKPAAYEKYGPKIAAGLRYLGAAEEQVAAATPVIWRNLVDVAPFFIPGDRNALVAAANAHANAPTAYASQVAARALMMIRLYLDVFPEMDTQEYRRALTPCIAGMLLHLEGNPATEDLLQKLEAGDTDQTLYALALCRHVVEAIAAVLTRNPIPPPPPAPPQLPSSTESPL